MRATKPPSGERYLTADLLECPKIMGPGGRRLRNHRSHELARVRRSCPQKRAVGFRYFLTKIGNTFTLREQNRLFPPLQGDTVSSLILEAL